MSGAPKCNLDRHWIVDWGNEFDGVLRCGLGYRTTQQRWLTGTAYRIDATSDDETHDRILRSLNIYAYIW
jgi:hypothetical protein